MSTAVSARYSWRVLTSAPSTVIAKWPPRSWSRRDAKRLGESNRGAQNQLITPSEEIRATVWRSPTMPWSAMGG